MDSDKKNNSFESNDSELNGRPEDTENSETTIDAETSVKSESLVDFESEENSETSIKLETREYTEEDESVFVKPKFIRRESSLYINPGWKCSLSDSPRSVSTSSTRSCKSVSESADEIDGDDKGSAEELAKVVGKNIDTKEVQPTIGAFDDLLHMLTDAGADV